jgi:tetratricopeptide (TPR) repeat protein/Zn-dependent protease with chaperone function
LIAHVAASTLVAAMAAAAALALRGQRAAWRHAILLAAVLRFALPTGWLVAAGERLAPHVPIQLRGLDGLGDLLRHPGAVAAIPTPPTTIATAQWATAIWAIGAALCLGLWTVRALRPIRAVRLPNAEELRAFPRVPLRIVAADRVPGACGIWRQHVILPDGLSQHLTGSELEAVVSHEMAHLRRRDNLWAALAHVVVSIFWFHPLLWWMERRMLAERETACDEMVLGQGANAAEYVSGIAKVCRMSFAGAQGYAGVTGANLHRRMEHIMSAHCSRTASRSRLILAGASILVAAMLPLASCTFSKPPLPPEPPPPAPQASKAKADTDFQTGMDQLQAKNYGPAYEAFERSYKANPADTRGLLGMVETRIPEGRNDDAEALLKKESQAHPSELDLKQALGNILTRAGRYDAALAVFQEMLDTVGPAANPKVSGDIYLRMGENYRRKGDYPAAIASLNHARELVPANVVVVSTLGLTLDQVGKSPEAMKAYRDVLALDPANGVALNNLAYAVVQTGGDPNEALQLALRAKTAMPDSDEAKDTLGWVYLKRKDNELAVDAFRQIVATTPSNTLFREHLALALDQRGDKSANVLELKSLLRAKPPAINEARIKELLQTLSR